MKYKKILVICPSNVVTGGAEALHQLVAHMNELKLNAFIVYLPFGHDAQTPKQYLKYQAPIAQFVDAPDSLIVFPEIYPMLALSIKKSQPAIWWLSLDNFLERRHISYIRDKLRYLKRVIKHQRPLRGASQLKNIIHFSQTEYATQYLRSCGIEPFPLIDSINEDYLTNSCLSGFSHKKNIILYNPTKGMGVTASLINANPQWKFEPLKDLNNEDLAGKFYSAKLYIDFGHHPGRDRMPREAVMHGCCLITGTLGSAGNLIDLPIPGKYKIDSSAKNFLNDFYLLANDLFIDFEKHYHEFDNYRDWLKNEPKIFKKQLADYFLG